MADHHLFSRNLGMSIALAGMASALLAGSALAQPRSAGAHVHGASALTIATAGANVEMRLVAPGSDIVGFERQARSDAERAAVDAALQTLKDPLALFAFAPDAGCSVTSASAEFTADHDDDDHHEGEDHEHGDEDHEGEEHADEEHAHEDHAHGDHAHKDGDDDHAHGEGEGHEHEHEHEHEDAHGGAGHAEFIADYALDCPGIAGVTSIDFAVFSAFVGMQTIAVQFVRDGRVGQFSATSGQPRQSF
jgi:hypothetical protein